MKTNKKTCYVKTVKPVAIKTLLYIFALFLICFLSHQNTVLVHAADIDVSATVPDQSFNAPVLLSPPNNSTINTTRPTFSWLRPSPVPATPLNHYDFYLDGTVFASNLSDSLTSVDFYFYSATASGGTFYLTLKTDLTQGYHTWSVTAYNNTGTSAASQTWTFYVDSIAPFISITKVHNTTLNWNTSNPSSIPPASQRYLTINTPNPIIKGGVEASANFQIVLVCPANIPTCVNQIYTGNIPTGLWSYQFFGLLLNQTYTVRASATDAAGNSTYFPDFYLTYRITAPTPTSSITPTDTGGFGPTATPTASPSAAPTFPLPSLTPTPPGGQLAIITPAPTFYPAPPSPTPPPVKAEQARVSPQDIIYWFLLILLIFGLPTHLFMTIYSTQTPLGFIPAFLYTLAYPFFRSKKYRTIPFSFITIFIADKLDRPWQKVISDIQGYYNLKNPVPDNLYIILTAVDRLWKSTLLRGNTLINSCLYPRPYTSPDGLSRLRKILYDTRIIPLIIACLTSITVMFIRPSYPVLIYAYFSLQYLFSEYLYPKISN